MRLRLRLPLRLKGDATAIGSETEAAVVEAVGDAIGIEIEIAIGISREAVIDPSPRLLRRKRSTYRSPSRTASFLN
jgi:hypothetical protein